MDLIKEISVMVGLVWLIISLLIMLRAISSDFCSKRKKDKKTLVDINKCRYK